MDAWDGYPAARERVFKAALDANANLISLAGDTHNGWAFDLAQDKTPVGVECVLTSVSSGGDGQDMRPGSDRILAENPQLKFINDQRGYGVCEVTPESWRTDFLVLDRVSTPGGTLSRRASAEVEAGSVNLAIT